MFSIFMKESKLMGIGVGKDSLEIQQAVFCFIFHTMPTSLSYYCHRLTPIMR